MLEQAFAEQFAAEWIEAWNSHDLQRILTHYTDDFEMCTPYIAQLTGEASGTLKGKEAVGAYWAKGLQRTPNLQFELLELLIGVNSLTLYYQNHRGQFVAEVLHFAENGKVEKAFAHYAS
jgi:ketosteroid isomerase-like protein